MYSVFKRIVRLFIPQYLINQFEYTFRSIYSLFYYGDNIFCVICQKQFSKFIKLQNGDQLCPHCGSLPRHRRLWKLTGEEIIVKQEDIILHFSPERCITKKLKLLHQQRYYTTDYDLKSDTSFHFDITAIQAKDESYTYVICYHVLEHIENDFGAMKELYRILKSEGKAIIQTPFKEGDIYENAEIKTKEERLKHFGQEDHVRIYSVNGLKERLENVGFTVTLKQYKNEMQTEYFGFKQNETILICKKINN
jgi:predicted SAM-dependent methyltransferase